MTRLQDEQVQRDAFAHATVLAQRGIADLDLGKGDRDGGTVRDAGE